MPQFDPAKLAELVTQEAVIANALREVSILLNEQYSTDKPWDDARQSQYSADQMRHGQLRGDLDLARRAREGYENLEPTRAKASQRRPLARWLRQGANGLDSDERELYLGESIDADLPGGGGETFRFQAAAGDATQSDDASGQEALQETVVPRVVDRLLHYGGVSQAAQQFMTAAGNEYRIPQMDATAQEGVIIAAQDTADAELGLPDIGAVVFGAKTATSKFIYVTREMIQDSIFDIQGYAERQAVRRMGRIWNKSFTTTQSGTGLPVGIVTSALPAITAASATAITWLELVNVIYSINRAYRENGEMGEGGFMPEGGGMIGYMISDSAEKAVRVMVDGDSRPLWVPSTREGVPSMLNGYPYVVNGHMASVATGNVPFLFGNFSYYGIRSVAAIELFRFMDSNTMQRNAIACLALSRRDARPMGAVRSATHAVAATRGKCEAYASITMG